MTGAVSRLKSKMNLPAGFAYATARFSGNGLQRGAVVTFGFKNPATTPTAQILCDDLRSAIETAFGTPPSIYSSTLKLVETTGKLGPLATGQYFVDAADFTLGSGTADAYSPNVAVLVRRSTANGGRRGQGRQFWPAPTEAAIDAGGALTTAARTTLQTAMDAVEGFMTEAGWLPYLIHRYYVDANGNPVDINGNPIVPPVPTAVIASSVEAFVATQRRRLVRA